MTLTKLDIFVKDYFRELQRKKSLKGVNNISIKLERSTRTQTLYVKFIMWLGSTRYQRTVRFSDHEPANERSGVRGLVLAQPNAITKSTLKTIKFLLYTEIKLMLLKAPRHLIYNFKAETPTIK